jgi:hypothetical protein
MTGRRFSFRLICMRRFDDELLHSGGFCVAKRHYLWEAAGFLSIWHYSAQHWMVVFGLLLTAMFFILMITALEWFCMSTLFCCLRVIGKDD